MSANSDTYIVTGVFFQNIHYYHDDGRGRTVFTYGGAITLIDQNFNKMVVFIPSSSRIPPQNPDVPLTSTAQVTKKTSPTHGFDMIISVNNQTIECINPNDNSYANCQLYTANKTCHLCTPGQPMC